MRTNLSLVRRKASRCIMTFPLTRNTCSTRLIQPRMS